ncbi:MAG: ATP-binding protein [Sandaracinaceae bacterium]
MSSDRILKDHSEVPEARDLPQSVLDNLLEGCQVIGRDFRYLYVNEAVARQGRTTPGALVGRTMMECYPGIEQTEMFSALRRCMDVGTPHTMENEFTFPDGSRGWFELRIQPVPDGVTILSVEVTQRKRAEAALLRSMRALATRSRCNQTLVRATDEARFVGDVCRLLVEAGGYRSAWIELIASTKAASPVLARAGDVSADADRCVTIDVRTGDKRMGALRLCASEPDTIGNDELALLEEIAQDIAYGVATLRAREAHASTEEQLIAAQRLEAVGRLAGGVAHDFNNLLTVILTYARHGMGLVAASERLHEDLEQVCQAGERAAELTRQLLAFSRKQILEPRVTNVNDVLDGIEAMLGRLIGEDVDIAMHRAADLGNVLADPGQLEQVIFNLAVNARDAMPQGGKLTIETSNVDLDEAFADEHVSMRPGPFVLTSVTDSGVGMDAETAKRAFEPFFTTKETGKGTGLGLSTVYGIVKQTGGNVWVYSEVGRGTTFKIYLPRVDAPVEPRAIPTSAPPVTRSGETVLLVEDDDAVRRATGRILRSAGYHVLAASSGNDALREAEAHSGEIDLLLTDVVMPGMGGRELARRIAERYPSIKILFASGYTENAIAHQGVLDAGARFIGKPFSGGDLTKKIRSVLKGE